MPATPSLPSRMPTLGRLARLALMAGLAWLSAFSQAAHAQDAPWPNRPIRLVVPYAAGGFADLRARKLMDGLARSLGQPVIIDNRGGAGGVPGTDQIAKATDGHTFGFGSPGPLVTNPVLMKKLPYDAERDLLPVVLIEEAPFFLVVSLKQPYTTLAELMAAARAQPGRITYGSSGVGGVHHLSAELLADRAGLDLVHVPYKGGAPASADLMAGHLVMMFEMGYAALPAIQAGKVRPLAVTSAQRLAVLPQVPTMAEAGLPGFSTANWLGLVAPAQTPPAVLQRLNQAVNEAMQAPEFRAMVEGSGGRVVGGSPQAFAQYLAAERQSWGALIRKARITLE